MESCGKGPMFESYCLFPIVLSIRVCQRDDSNTPLPRHVHTTHIIYATPPPSATLPCFTMITIDHRHHVDDRPPSIRVYTARATSTTSTRSPSTPSPTGRFASTE